MHLMLKSKKKQVRATQRSFQKKTTHILYPSGIEFTYSKRREWVHKIQHLAMWSPMLGYLPPFWQKRFCCIHHISCCNRRIMTIPLGLEIQKAGGLPEGHWYMCLGRTKAYILSLKQGKMVPQKAINPEKAVSSLCFLVIKCSCMGWKMVCIRLPFLTLSYLFFFFLNGHQYFISPYLTIRN